MRIGRWNAKEIFDGITIDAINTANDVMDEVVMAAKRSCPVGTITREGKWKTATVAFTARAGTKSAKAVSFQAKQFSGRNPGDLRNSIRRVNKISRPGNIRVYAGNKAVNYAYFVEHGTIKIRACPFMRSSFNSIKNSIVPKIQKKVKE